MLMRNKIKMQKFNNQAEVEQSYDCIMLQHFVTCNDYLQVTSCLMRSCAVNSILLLPKHDVNS